MKRINEELERLGNRKDIVEKEKRIGEIGGIRERLIRSIEIGKNKKEKKVFEKGIEKKWRKDGRVNEEGKEK